MMKSHGLRRIFSLLLAVIMVCAILPAAVFAEDTTETEPVAVEVPQSEDPQEPKPVAAEDPQSEDPQEPKPVAAEDPQSEDPQEPKPVAAEDPQSEGPQAPKPVAAEGPENQDPQEPKQEEAKTFTVTYTDGVNEPVFTDDIHSNLNANTPTPAFTGGTPTREGYTFKGWNPAVAETVTGDATYTAIWVEAANVNGEPPAVPSVAWIEGKGYPTLEEAVTAAVSGATIELGEGNFTLYPKKVADADIKGKSLTFVGKGADKTTWVIGAEVPDPAHFGTEYNGDYSFDGAGTITFRNMTLQSGKADYLGFIRADKTVVENCIINGKTFYWGYSSAKFTNTTFNCPEGDYALWTYSSPVMTFDGCTFNSSGKTINVYTDYSAGTHDITVNFSNCTVNSEAAIKSVLNINDSNMGNYKYRINISGNNSITGPVFRDKVTCSRWFGFGGKPASNTGRSDVTFDGKPVFQDGKMLGHELHKEYTDGFKDNAYTVTTTEWVKAEDGTHYTRSVKKVCDYCGNIAETNETGYSVTYTDGVDSAEIFKDQNTVVPENADTPAFEGNLKRDGYVFSGWKPAVAANVTRNQTYTATWKVDANGNGIPDEEDKYTVTYTDGVKDKVIFKDDVHENLVYGTATPKFDGTPKRDGYVFDGWNPAVADKVTENATYTATWKADANNNGIPDDKEDKYTVTYTDGVKGKAFADQVYDDLLSGIDTPAFNGKPTRKGYTFVSWTPKVTDTVTKTVTYTATWKSSSGKDNVPKTGDGEIVMVLGSVLLFSFCGAAAVCVCDRKRKQS